MMDREWTQQDFINKGRKEKALKIITYIRSKPAYRDRTDFTEQEWDDFRVNIPLSKGASADTRTIVLNFLRGSQPQPKPPAMSEVAYGRPVLVPKPSASIIDETRGMLAKHLDRGCQGCPTCDRFRSAIAADDLRRRKAEIEKAFEDF